MKNDDEYALQEIDIAVMDCREKRIPVKSIIEHLRSLADALSDIPDFDEDLIEE